MVRHHLGSWLSDAIEHMTLIHNPGLSLLHTDHLRNCSFGMLYPLGLCELSSILS